MQGPEKNSYQEFDNEKKFLQLENSPPPPHNFSNGPSLSRQYMERNTEDVNISLENAMKILTKTSKLCLKIKAKKT